MNTTPTTTSFLQILYRIFWMMLGPLLLVLFTVHIVQTGNGWLTKADFAFLGVLGCVALARYLEFREGNPQTASGEPATAADLRRYLLVVVPAGLGVYALANLIANHWLA